MTIFGQHSQIVNKDRWAQTNYRITIKTLLSYEREFQDQRQTVLAAADCQ